MNIQNQLNENIFVFPHLNAACKKKVSERLGQPQAANGMREHNFYEYLKLARFGKKKHSTRQKHKHIARILK